MEVADEQAHFEEAPALIRAELDFVTVAAPPILSEVSG